MKCNVYEVEVLINNFYNSKTELKKKYNILAISEDAAKNKAKNLLRWENKEILEHNPACVTYPLVRLLVENVEY